VKAQQRIHCLDGEVAAIWYDDAGLKQRAPCVRAEETALAESAAGPVHVARLMDGLHRRNDAELREARNVVVVENLRVLHAEAMIRRRLEL
jgi:hypothetical protein